jgi:integrase
LDFRNGSSQISFIWTILSIAFDNCCYFLLSSNQTEEIGFFRGQAYNGFIMMKPSEHPDLPVPYQPALPEDQRGIQIGKAANRAAARHKLEDYRSRRAAHTLRRQDADLALFAHFLKILDVKSGNLALDPQAWQEITWGLVEAFIKWQLQEGYAIQSINVHLSTVKTYARLVFQAGILSAEEHALIQAVKGYSVREQRRVDLHRAPHTRIGFKKAAPVKLNHEQAQALKDQPNTPQGRRDTLLMCLLLDHGLRVGEVAGILVENLDLQTGMLCFFRPKVGKKQTHRLSTDTLGALRACASFNDLPIKGKLLRSSYKNDSLGHQGMTERAITLRVRTLGESIGISGLSAHDCRHFWATSAANYGTDPFVLQEAGGWSSLAMPRRYVEERRIANEGVKKKEADS